MNKYTFKQHFHLWAIFLFLICPCIGFCSSPRLLVTLGPRCHFSHKFFQRKVGGTIVFGKKESIREKIRELDKSNDRLVILRSPISDFENFCWEIGYAHLHLNDIYPRAIKKFQNTVSTLPLTDADLPRIDPKEVGLFYDMLMKIDAIFNQHDIQYWATCGTLLGALRHEGMIPWDDDMDIAIFEKDLPNLLALKQQLDQVGLELCYHSYFDFYKICTKDGSPIVDKNGNLFPWTYPSIDIFPLREINHEKTTYTYEGWQKSFARDYFLLKNLSFPMQRMKFGPMWIPVPSEIVSYIERMYGTDWNDVAYVSFSHRDEKFLMKVKVDLFDRSPADYILPEIKEE